MPTKEQHLAKAHSLLDQLRQILEDLKHYDVEVGGPVTLKEPAPKEQPK